MVWFHMVWYGTVFHGRSGILEGGAGRMGAGARGPEGDPGPGQHTGKLPQHAFSVFIREQMFQIFFRYVVEN